MTPPGDAETITVVLPYFNRADSLPRAIDSVLSQTHEALRLLLVDDCSSDGSAAVARSRHDSRVLHLSTPWNGGASAARNTGLERASSRLVAFMDSDDRWLPDKLERQLKHLRLAQASGRAVAVLGCGWRYEDGSAAGRSFPSGPHDRQAVLGGRVNGIGTPMLLVDRAFGDSRFDVQLPALEDRDYVLGCLANRGTVAVLPRGAGRGQPRAGGSRGDGTRGCRRDTSVSLTSTQRRDGTGDAVVDGLPRRARALRRREPAVRSSARADRAASGAPQAGVTWCWGLWGGRRACRSLNEPCPCLQRAPDESDLRWRALAPTSDGRPHIARDDSRRCPRRPAGNASHAGDSDGRAGTGRSVRLRCAAGGASSQQVGAASPAAATRLPTMLPA